MHGSHCCKIYFELSQFANDSAPHVQHPANLKRKFVGPFLEALTKESCSDAWDPENGLRLLLVEKIPDGIEKPSHHSQPHPPGSRRTLL